jgi:hypothetical protein
MKFSGIYYKFRDGIKIKSRKFFFYLDIVAAMPFELFYEDNDQNPVIFPSYKSIC